MQLLLSLTAPSVTYAQDPVPRGLPLQAIPNADADSSTDQTLLSDEQCQNFVRRYALLTIDAKTRLQKPFEKCTHQLQGRSVHAINNDPATSANAPPSAPAPAPTGE